MGFGDLKSDNGLKALNDFLADRSYIEGFTASQADSVVFAGLSGAPKASFPHALRWFNHIKSMDRSALPGVKKSLDSYGSATAAAAGGGDAKDDDDDFDLFGSDDDGEAEKLKQERLKAYADKKAKKPALIAKSNIILEVKPWDDETDMKKLEESVRSVNTDGLVWGVSKLVPVGYGINKLQITCVVEDAKVGTDFLEESITAFEDYVQSVDVLAFNKV
ncbi:elongation factor 1-beta-like [Babylonia areolata]|uniref:elongation factor 1-beta-like n=1 Tax=Babylonia areolata TaxID=304850 RepID=UPI003FD5DE7F